MVLACSNFFGPTSVFAQLLRVKSPVGILKEVTLSGGKQTLYPATQICDYLILKNVALPPKSAASALLLVFHHSINTFYTVFGLEQINQIRDAIYDSSRIGQIGTWETPTIYLIFAISLQLISKGDPHMAAAAAAGAFFHEAVREWETSVEPYGTATIRIVILVCIYVLLNPSAGDVWRLLGFVSRICLELANDDDNSDTGKEREEHSILYRTVYCLEWQV